MKISYCLNPDCLYKNPSGTKSCQRCGSILLLGDRYRAVGCLGAGGMSRTFFAVDEHRLDTPCVIKQFSTSQQKSAALKKLIQLFKQEAVRLRDLGKHPQIPDLLAFFEQERRLYLVQEFIDGPDLLKELKQKGALSEQQVRQVLTDLLPVLQFVHDHQVIHRDIKPANIIRRRDGSLVLIDFGVAKQLNSTVPSTSQTITGTLGYMAPEQMRGMVFPASDLYALGVSCIRLLTGCLPKSDSSDQLFDPMKMQWKWQERVSVSRNLEIVLDKLLQDKVSDRYQSAAEVLQALNSKPIAPNISSPPSRLSVSTSRYKRGSAKGSLSSEQRDRRRGQNVSSAQPSVSLASDVGADYRKLQELLAAQKYKEADLETYRVMLSVARREKEGWLRTTDIDQFPCTDLRTIDRLWVEYSRWRFGFSIQKRTYQTLGGTKKYNKQIWLEFCDSVGWRVGGKWLSYSNLTFDLSAPLGHLPVANPTDLVGGMVGLDCSLVEPDHLSSLVERLATCEI